MDRLYNVTRTGGYPWCAEEIAIIDKFGDYINSLLDSLKLSGGSCVFVQRNQDQNGKLMKSVVYIVPSGVTNGHGELFELAADSGVVVAELLAGTATKRAITITTAEVDVEGSQSQSWTYCYNTKTAVLATGTAYTFYDLNDLLRPAVWEGSADANLNDVVEQRFQSVGVNIALATDYQQVMRKNNNELESCLRYVKIGQLSYQWVISTGS